MMRQAVPLLKVQAPFVGTGMESVVAEIQVLLLLLEDRTVDQEIHPELL